MQHSRRNPGAFLFGLLAYASFGASLAYLVGFLTNFAALPVTVDRGAAGPAWLAVTVDVLLIALFGIQHSTMARPSFKERWTRIVPRSIERSVYVLISSAVTLLLCLVWRPVPGVIWAADTMPMIYLSWALFGVGLAILFAASFQIDHWELLGLRQTWNDWRGKAAGTSEFTLRGFYRIVRHPIYVGWLLLFWVTPEMSAGHLLLAAGMTVYTLIAIRFEEVDLVNEFGARYREYQRQVPALVPRPMTARGAKLGRKRERSLLALACIGIALGTAQSRAAVSEERLMMTVDGRERTTWVVTPAAVARPGRIVIMLHGAGGNADRFCLFCAGAGDSIDLDQRYRGPVHSARRGRIGRTRRVEPGPGTLAY